MELQTSLRLTFLFTRTLRTQSQNPQELISDRE